MTAGTVIPFVFYMLVMDSIEGFLLLHLMTLDAYLFFGILQTVPELVLQVHPVCVPMTTGTL